ncbi:MAG: nitrilase-related carbon-nitrogen hydrolase, partial [Planctomycetota bacterium]
IYRKQRLLPLGERFPPRLLLPDSWCDALFGWLVRHFGYPAGMDVESGEGFAVLDAGPGLRCAPLIYSEALHPHLARGAARQEGVDLLLHLANHGWFRRSWMQAQAVPIWVFRAIETRLPFLSCSNGGVSCAVAPSGEFVGTRVGTMDRGVVSVRVPARWEASPYSRGAWLLLPAALGAALATLGAVAGRGRVSQGPQSEPVEPA